MSGDRTPNGSHIYYAECHPAKTRYAQRMCKSCYSAWYFGRHGVPAFVDASKYGVPAEDLRAMWRAQDGACAICRVVLGLGTRGVHIDHDHVTGAVRGLLCAACNVMLGQAGDDVGVLEGAVAYLSREV